VDGDCFLSILKGAKFLPPNKFDIAPINKDVLDLLLCFRLDFDTPLSMPEAFSTYGDLISPELDQAMLKVLKTVDPLDRSGFDPINYVNELFPNGEAKIRMAFVLTGITLLIVFKNNH
jgi:hypothetical protein